MNIPNHRYFSQEAGTTFLQLCILFLPACSLRVAAWRRHSPVWFEVKFCNFAIFFLPVLLKLEMAERHAEAGAALGYGAERRAEAAHFGHWCLSIHNASTRFVFHAGNDTAT